MGVPPVGLKKVCKLTSTYRETPFQLLSNKYVSLIFRDILYCPQIPPMGAAADCTVAPELLNGFTAEAVIADKGYDSQEIVELIEHSGAKAMIPPRKNRKRFHLNK